MFKILSDVPVPPRTNGRLNASKYPFGQFHVPASDHLCQKRLRSTLWTAASTFRRRNPGAIFAIRLIDKAVGVWRVK